MHKQKAPNPFADARGFWGRVNRVLYPITGPAALGAGHPEEPYRAPADPVCPVCGALLADHVIDRSLPGARSSLNCPV